MLLWVCRILGLYEAQKQSGIYFTRRSIQHTILSHKIAEISRFHVESETDKKLSYCWETVRRESMPRIAEMDVEMTT